MPDVFRDPVIDILKYAYRMSALHNLQLEAALFAAAFVLCEHHNYLMYAEEAAYYVSLAQPGDFITTLSQAVLQRRRDGTLGTTQVAVAPKQKPQNFTRREA